MLPAQYRLPSYKIAELMRTGLRTGNAWLEIRRQERETSHPRAAIIVSTNVAKDAVRRNRMKRLMRESLRGFLHRIRPADMVIIIRKIIPDTPGDTQQALKELLAKAGLL